MRDTGNNIEDLCYLVGFKEGITTLQAEISAVKVFDSLDKLNLDCKIRLELEKVNRRLKMWLGHNSNGALGPSKK